MRYAINFNGKNYPITEEELPKVIQAMDKKGVVVLKCGIFSGAFIGAVVRDLHAESGTFYGYRIEDEVKSSDYSTDLPEKIRDLKLGSNIKLLN